MRERCPWPRSLAGARPVLSPTKRVRGQSQALLSPWIGSGPQPAMAELVVTDDLSTGCLARSQLGLCVRALRAFKVDLDES